MKNRINSLFFMLNISITLSCNDPVINDKPVLYDNDIEVVKLINEITDNEKLVQQNVESDSIINSLPYDLINQECIFYDLSKLFSKELLLKAISRFERYTGFKLFELHDINYLDYNILIEQIISEQPNILDSLCFKIKYPVKPEEIKKKITDWCECYLIIEMLLHINTDMFLEEIIYEIPMTKKVILSFLTIKEQSWMSLSSSQVYEVPYRVCDYLCTLNDKERIYFLSVFLNRVQQTCTIQETLEN